MSLDFFNQFNWIDILVAIILFRIAYVALRSGFPAELFKLLGTTTAIYLSLHYYSVFANSFKQAAVLKLLSFDFLAAASFFLLAIFGYTFFVFLRNIFERFLKLEAVPTLNKWGGFILGLARGFLATSLILCFFTVSGITYFNKSLNDSYARKHLFDIAPVAYAELWANITSKFMPQEKFNDAIYGIKNKDPKKR